MIATIVVVLSSACISGNFWIANPPMLYAIPAERPHCVTRFERIQSSTGPLKDGEWTIPLCVWMGHNWEEIDPNCFSQFSGGNICESPASREKYKQCLYCGRRKFKRLKQREEWEEIEE